MSLLVSLLAAVVVFIAGWAVIKRYPTVIVLFAAGLIMIGLAILFGADSILPKNAKTTGLIWFDAIRPASEKCRQQFSGIFGVEHCIRQAQMLSCAAPDRGTGEKACHGEFHA